MKSMLEKQAPQRSPWLPMRILQEMQTGGRRRSAIPPKSGRASPRQVHAAKAAAGASSLSSASASGMIVVIREPFQLKGLNERPL